MEQVGPHGQVTNIVHFVHGEPNRIACMPNMTELHATLHHPNFPRTNEVRAVSCPACKCSGPFLAAEEALQAGLRSGPLHRGAPFEPPTGGRRRV